MKTILIIENSSHHSTALSRHLKSYNVRTIKYRQLNSDHMAKADIIILSGGHPSVLHHYWFYRSQLELIRSTPKPVIGVCLGFELIVRAYGGKLQRLKRKVHGLRSIEVTNDTLDLSLPRLNVWEAHKWAARSVPSEYFNVVAQSEQGIEIIQHKTRPIFGCQFHPEINKPVNDGGTVLDAILTLINSSPL